MKKLMRIALVFALAGATLVGCTKDYSGDISDLNKKVSEQTAALSALQTQVGAAQNSANEALASAQNALKEAQAAAKAAEEANNNEEVAALTARVAAIEGDIAEIEARVKALEDVSAELKATIAAGDKANKDAIDALTVKVNELLEGCYADFTSIAAPAASVTVNYEYAKFDLPSDLTVEPYKSLIAAFPEVKDFKGNEITQGGHVPFTVNPESTEFDDTFTYEFVGVDGKTFGTLTEPVEGFVGVSNGEANGTLQTKAANGFWTLSFAPTIANSEWWNPKSPLVVANADVKNLSLVITKGENRAATSFAYWAKGTKVSANPDVDYPNGQKVKYAETIDLFSANTGLPTGPVKIVNFKNILNGKFIFSAAAGSDNALAIEKYGVKFGEPGESTIKVTKYPENVRAIEFEINVKCFGLNGKAYQENFTLKVEKAIDADGILAAQEITLNDKNTTYPVRWNLADYDFTKAETKEFVEAPSHTLTFTYVDPYTGQPTLDPALTQELGFYKKDGKTPTTAWDEAVSFGFDLDASIYWPDTYAVEFTVGDADAAIYAAKSTITVKNAEDYLVYLLKELCDEDGVLQAVGTPEGGFIQYDIENAFVNEYNNVEYAGFADAEYNIYAPGDKVTNYNWAKDGETLVIPINGTLEDPTKPMTSPKYDYVNKTVRNVVAYFEYFGNDDNVVAYPFQVKVVSPVAGGIVPQDQEIFFNDEPNSFYVRAAVDSAVYVAGWKSGIEYNVIKYTPDVHIIGPSYYYYDLDENIESVTIAFNDPAKAEKFIVKGAKTDYFDPDKFAWTIKTGNNYNRHNADATKFEVKANQNYSEQTDLPAGYVILPATVTVTDKWGIVEKLPFNVKVSIKK